MRNRALWWTLALAAVLVSATVIQAQDHTFVGAEKCKMCHKVQYNSWLESTHAKATEAAKASTEREFSADCLKCHATNADEALAGVQCEACHGAGSDFKKMSIMKDQEKAMANGLVVPSQEICDGCHIGDDHAKKVVLAEQKTNKAAIHDFKNAPE